MDDAKTKFFLVCGQDSQAFKKVQESEGLAELVKEQRDNCFFDPKSLEELTRILETLELSSEVLQIQEKFYDAEAVLSALQLFASDLGLIRENSEVEEIRETFAKLAELLDSGRLDRARFLQHLASCQSHHDDLVNPTKPKAARK